MSKFPIHSYVKTETYFEGKLVSKEFYDSNPEIFKDYPSKENILKIKADIESKIQPEVHYKILISEFGVSVEEFFNENLK